VRLKLAGRRREKRAERTGAGAIKTMGAGLKAMRQGEVTQYAELLEDSPKHAIDRLIENARLLGANAVVAARFDSSGIAQAAHRGGGLRDGGCRPCLMHLCALRTSSR